MKRALFLGRFQPFHDGHLWALKRILKSYDQVIIVIGSTQATRTSTDPFLAKERKRIIEAALAKKSVTAARIYFVSDITEDKKYVHHLECHVPRFEAVYTGNPLVASLFKKAGYRIFRLPKHRGISATTVRHLLWEGKNVKSLVPAPTIVVKLYQKKAEKMRKDSFIKEAIREARKGQRSGGIPIGSVLVKAGKIVGRGHNRRVQDSDPIMHAEIACLQNAGRLKNYNGTTLYSTLMPCYLCAGAIVQFRIGKVVAGESKSFRGARKFMESHGVKIVDLDDAECKDMMVRFIKKNPRLWAEDIGNRKNSL